MGRLATGLFAVSLLTAGCAEEGEESFQVHAPARQELHCAEIPRASADDSFWLAQAIVEANRPPPTAFRSTVSLGYVGDAPLSNGVMHDTALQPRAYPDPFAAMSAPFTRDHWTNTPCARCGTYRWR